MAYNTDKSLYQAPVGMADTPDEATLEIEILAPDDTDISDLPDEPLTMTTPDKSLSEDGFGENLAEHLDEGEIAQLVGDLARDVDNDKNSRKDWEKTYTEGLKLLGLQIEERTEPWNGACGVFHPMITEAVVRFQSETITETFPAAGPVKTKIIGKETPEIKEAAARVQDDMNYELTEVMSEFRGEHERMLWNLPAAGSAFKKVYYDPSLQRQVSMFVPADDVYLPYGTTDMSSCYRVTHILRKTEDEIIKLQEAGFYADVEIGEPTRNQTDIQKAKDKETGFDDLNDERYQLCEVMADLVIEGDPYRDADSRAALPYVVTYIKGTETVLAIRRNWDENDPLKLKRQHFVHYQYIPGFGAYGFGLFHLIGGFAKASTSILRQLVDAGTLSNLPGGLKSRGLRIKGDDTPIAPGEFRDVDVASGNIRDSILPLPYKEPSTVLAALLDKIVEEGRRFAATADLKIADMSGESPVGTTLALLERQLKVLTAVQARVHHALKQELKLLKAIIRDYTDPEYTYDPEYGKRRAKQSDYDLVDVIPVSDPNAATMSQRVVQYQAVIQMAQMAPDIYDMPQLHRGMLEVLGIKNADKLVPLPDDMVATDPVTENQHILTGSPVKAFLRQDHKSHIAVHNMLTQDPTIAQQLGQNPQAQAIMAALQAHIAEHMGYQMREQIEAQLGMPMPEEDEEVSPEAEKAMAPLLAQAAMQTMQMNQQQAAAQAAQQAAQDPLVQIQQQELQLKQQDTQIKQLLAQVKQQELELKKQKQQQDFQLASQKLVGDMATAADRQALEEEKVRGELELKGMQHSHTVEESGARLAADQEHRGVQLGVQIAGQRAQERAAAKQAALQHGREVNKPPPAPPKGPADK